MLLCGSFVFICTSEQILKKRLYITLAVVMNEVDPFGKYVGDIDQNGEKGNDISNS